MFFLACTTAATLQHRVAANLPRIKIYYINLGSSSHRRDCMKSQLEPLEQQGPKFGLKVDVQRFPAFNMGKCSDVTTCMAKYPSCFPSGFGFASHGRMMTNPELRTQMVRGVFGDACSHLKVLQQIMETELDTYDYFLVLEDDVKVSNGLLGSLRDLLSRFPRFWTLIAIDTFASPPRPTPQGDYISENFTHGLPLTSISPSKATYWGSHAWLFNSDNVPLFLRFYEKQPTMNADWYTKIPSPLHMGMWAYNPGALAQLRLADGGAGDNASESCTKSIQSDIGEMQFTQIAASSRLSSEETREVIVLGMEASGVKKVKLAIRQHLEKPLGVKLCHADAGGNCGGVPDKFNLANWSQLSALRGPEEKPLNQAIAVIVVTHPFTLTTDRWARDQPLMCDDDLCASSCATMARSHWSFVPCQWNTLTKSARDLSRSDLFRRVLILRQEDVEEFPEMAARKIGKAAGLRAPRKASSNKATFFRETEGEVHSARFLNTMRYESPEDCDRLQAMCASIHRNAMWKYGYHGCQLIVSDYADEAFEAFDEPPAFHTTCSKFMDTFMLQRRRHLRRKIIVSDVDGHLDSPVNISQEIREKYANIIPASYGYSLREKKSAPGAHHT